MKMLADLTAERLREVLSYDPESGIFRWKKSRRNVNTGKVAGTPCSGGYISIGVDQKYYKAHRLAWLYVHGVWPAELIDHINGDTSNNRISNLREATFSQNLVNRGPNTKNKTGFKGVFHNKDTGRFIACAAVNKKQKTIGSYATAEEASAAYREFVTKWHGEFVHPSVRVPFIQQDESADERAGT